MVKKWETYEKVAAYLLNKLAEEFDLKYVDGKKRLTGKSGTRWEIDAIGYMEDGFKIIECKRYKSSASQEIVVGLCFRMQDAGASGAIIATTKHLQSGAKKVANHVGIQHVILNEDCSTVEYVMEFLNSIYVGLHDEYNFPTSDSITITVIKYDKNGNKIKESTQT